MPEIWYDSMRWCDYKEKPLDLASKKKIYHMLKNNLMEGIYKNYNQLSKSIFPHTLYFPLHLSSFFLFCFHVFPPSVN